MQIDTLFNAQTQKMTSCSREKLRMATTGQLYFISVTLEVKQQA